MIVCFSCQHTPTSFHSEIAPLRAADQSNEINKSTHGAAAQLQTTVKERVCVQHESVSLKTNSRERGKENSVKSERDKQTDDGWTYFLPLLKGLRYMCSHKTELTLGL